MIRSETRIGSSISGWIDLVRGMAAIAVLLEHARNVVFSNKMPLIGLESFIQEIIWKLSGLSHQAVIVFFVISGYLVGGTFLVKYRNGSATITSYLISRGSRMYTVLLPALILTLAAAATFNSLGGENTIIQTRPGLYLPSEPYSEQFGLNVLVCNALFLQMIFCPQYGGNLSLWSLSHEFWYYMLFLSLVAGFTNRFWFVVSAAILALFFASALRAHGPELAVPRFIAYFLVWVSGVAAYAIEKTPRVVSAAAAVGAISAVLYLALPSGDIWRSLCLAGVVGAAAVVAEWLDFFPSRLQGRLLSGLAGMSYSLYATHLPVLLLTIILFGAVDDWSFGAKVLVFATCLLTALLVAAAFYWAFERHTKTVRDVVTRHIAAFRDRALGSH